MPDLAADPNTPVQRRLRSYVQRRFGDEGDSCRVSKLLGDASTRQYYRLALKHGECYILAAYPEPFDAERFPYLEVYRLMRKIGLPVPRVDDVDGELGVVLQEDLGDETLQRHFLEADGESRRRLIEQAIGYIVKLQEEGTAALDSDSHAAQTAFDFSKLEWELRFFRRHYLLNYRGLAQLPEKGLQRDFEALAAELSERPKVLCHRDFHVRNLMLRPDELFIIDFQDARMGPASYDLVSLLKDSIELAPQETEDFVGFYLDLAKPRVSADEFRREFELMSVQRLLKALGTYGYQIVERKHPIYEEYINGTLRRALASLRSLGCFPEIRGLMESEV